MEYVQYFPKCVLLCTDSRQRKWRRLLIQIWWIPKSHCNKDWTLSLVLFHTLLIALKYGLIWIGVPDLIWATPRKYLVAVLRLKVDLDLFHVPEKQQPPLCYIYRRKQSLLVLVHGCYSYQLVQVPFKKNSFKDANISKIWVFTNIHTNLNIVFDLPT